MNNGTYEEMTVEIINRIVRLNNEKHIISEAVQSIAKGNINHLIARTSKVHNVPFESVESYVYAYAAKPGFHVASGVVVK